MPSPQSATGPTLRRARADELATCAEIWRAGLDGYGPRVGRLPMAAPPESLVPLLAHLRATDPERFLVALRPDPAGGERVVAFASAIRRAGVWFLGMLFVHPGEQAHGLGRALLEAILPAADDPACRATCTDAAQPISNALYARYGIVPRLPVLELVGRPDPARLAALPAGIRAVPFEVFGTLGAQAAGGTPGTPGAPRVAAEAAGAGAGHLASILDALDESALGYAHPQDHAFVATTGRVGYVYLTGTGRAVGYGYTSRAGRVGPVAVEDEALLAGILGHLLRAVEPAGAFATWMPGAAGSAVTTLLEAGLRIEDFPALLCWDRPFADFSRYVPITLAVP